MLTLLVRRVLPALLLGSLTLSSCVTAYRRGPGPPPPPRAYYRHGHGPGRPYGPPPPPGAYYRH